MQTVRGTGAQPQAYRADVITCIVAGHPLSRLDDLLPWAYAPQPPAYRDCLNTRQKHLSKLRSLFRQTEPPLANQHRRAACVQNQCRTPLQGRSTMGQIETSEPEHDSGERWAVLYQLEDWLQTPMVVLSFAWLLLVLTEFAWGTSYLLETFGTVIWIIFIGEFGLRLALAPDKLGFLRGNIVTIIALAVPAFRLVRAFRILRFARAVRSLRLVRIVGTANRGMSALKASLGRRGLGYVLAVTVFVALLGAGGMLTFEPAGEVEGGFTSYGDALWWTAMLLTSMGSDFWPRTPEGRLLCLLLAIYGFAVFGYITASFASFFVGRDASSVEAEIAGASDIAALREEIAGLRQDLNQRT